MAYCIISSSFWWQKTQGWAENLSVIKKINYIILLTIPHPCVVQHSALVPTALGGNVCSFASCRHAASYLNQALNPTHSIQSLSVVLSACNFKSACVSILDSSMKQCSYLSTLLYRLDVSNVLINHHDISEMWTVFVNKLANFLTPSCCVPSCWIFSSHLLEVLPVCLFLSACMNCGWSQEKR